ncbi:hypothetical protein F5Y10DRAFT_272219 [Nemania abortiva]|nr:hypothetical protein F5Y10DRAFT_272219 [Nemania abortiva]
MIPSFGIPLEAHYPVAGVSSDGADDNGLPRMARRDMPRYDTTRDADAVPEYTREYLQRLSAALDARLKIVDNEVAYYPEALTKTRRVHRCITSVLAILGLLWLATSIVILVAIFRDNRKFAAKDR